MLLGSDLYDQDTHRTPLSKVSDEKMPGTLVQAHLTAQILDGRGYRDLQETTKAILAAMLLFIGVLVGFSGLRFIWFGMSLPVLLFIAADTIAFLGFDRVLPFVISAIAWGYWSCPLDTDLPWLTERAGSHFRKDLEDNVTERRLVIACALALSALVVALGSNNAQAQLLVLSSNWEKLPANTELGEADRLNIPDGIAVRVLLPSGSTHCYHGAGRQAREGTYQRSTPGRSALETHQELSCRPRS